MSHRETNPYNLISEPKAIPRDSVYPELQQFLQQIEPQELSILHQPYFANKGKVFTYRLIFFFFSCLFLLLGTVVFFKTPNWVFHHFLWDGYLVKYLICGTIVGLSTIALLMGFLMKTEHEVVNFLELKAKSELKRQYRQKCARFSFLDAFPFGKGFEKKGTLRHQYLDSVENLHRTKQEYVLLLKRIALTTTIPWPAKEKLFNQTLVKFTHFTSEVIDSFSGLPLF